MSEHSLARQPILDVNNTIYAYEILFRQNKGLNRMIGEATEGINEQLIRSALGAYSQNDLLGSHKGFINVDHTFFQKDYGDIFPPQRYIYELLGSTKVTPELVSQISDLHAQGHQFALSEFVFEDWYIKMFSPLFKYASYVKIDLRKNSMMRVKQLAGNLKQKLKCKLVAEKVETRDEFSTCASIGFDYFQGYYFAQPQIVKMESLDPSLTKVLEIIGMLNANDTEMEEIIRAFAQAPELEILLVNFLNSGAFGLRQGIRSIRHALTLLGRKKVVSWLMVMAGSMGPTHKRHPALITALVRARTMEILIEAFDDGKYRNTADSGFFVGMLSLVDVLLHAPKEEILRNIKAHDKIQQAVLKYEGTMGQMLEAIIAHEQDDVPKACEIVENLLIPFSVFSEATLQAYVWADSLLSDGQ
ncbi:EAL and HDOD domain-containing protein [Chrysiogenes arsenatis]|uniref:EAL and HDOD domain-containing protein n=1 Tax=Chrysiogenes arsenatis TaxID=309797 RepID=UPI000407F0A4|nr:EAL domain-containing protein [Chrysiogenes arsenatis]